MTAAALVTVAVAAQSSRRIGFDSVGIVSTAPDDNDIFWRESLRTSAPRNARLLNH